MAVPFSQLLSSTYDDVVNVRNEAADQWSDSSFLKALERLGGLKRIAGGATLQLTLDYRQNSGTDFLATDVTPTGTTKTDVLTAASYSLIPLVVPVNWSLFDEAVNSEPNQKVDLIASLVDNALRSHDWAFESAMFAATGGTDGFNTLVDLYAQATTGVVGTIDSGVETWWKNRAKDYTDGAALVADLTTVYNDASKGSSGRQPNIIVTSALGSGLLEGKIVNQQRWGKQDTTARIAFDALQFKNADVIFSGAYTGKSFFMFNTEDTQLFVVRSAWRQRRTPVEHINAAMMNMKVFSVAQLATRNRSRGGVVFTTTP